MLEQSLTNICAILGIGLYTASFTLFKIFKEPVDNYVTKKIGEIRDSEEIKKIVDMVADEDINIRLVKEFYDLVLESHSPKKLLGQSWAFSALSGTFLIIAAIFGNFDINIINEIALAGLVYGVGLFLISIYYVIQLVLIVSK